MTSKQSTASEQQQIVRSEYEAFDDFDFDMDDLNMQITQNTTIQKAVDNLTSLMSKDSEEIMDKLKGKGKLAYQNAEQIISDRVSKVERRLKRRRQRIEKMMVQAPFWRKLDKLAYVFGTTLIICYSSMMGRYPHDLIYIFVSILLPTFISLRAVEYTIKGWHMFLIDFCYFVNSSLIYFLMNSSGSQNLFVACFVFSNGPLAAAIVAFRNSLVYHKIDFLMSLAIHAVPMTVMTHIRWHTIPEQAGLPKEQQRFPVDLPDPENIS